MKKNIIVLASAIILGSVCIPVLASSKGSLTTDVNALLSTKVNAELQQAKGKGLTSYISGALINSPTTDATDLEVKAGFGVNRFFSVDKLVGPYFGGGLILDAKGISSYSESNFMDFGLKGHAGYKWVLGGGFTIDARGEANLDVISLTSDTGGTTLKTGDFMPVPKLGFYLGYSW